MSTTSITSAKPTVATLPTPSLSPPPSMSRRSSAPSPSPSLVRPSPTVTPISSPGRARRSRSSRKKSSTPPRTRPLSPAYTPVKIHFWDDPDPHIRNGSLSDVLSHYLSQPSPTAEQRARAASSRARSTPTTTLPEPSNDADLGHTLRQQLDAGVISKAGIKEKWGSRGWQSLVAYDAARCVLLGEPIPDDEQDQKAAEERARREPSPVPTEVAEEPEIPQTEATARAIAAGCIVRDFGMEEYEEMMRRRREEEWMRARALAREATAPAEVSPRGMKRSSPPPPDSSSPSPSSSSPVKRRRLSSPTPSRSRSRTPLSRQPSVSLIDLVSPSQTPPSRHQTPSSRQPTPSSRQPTPSSRQPTPSSRQHTPASRHHTPFSRHQTPSSRTSTPTPPASPLVRRSLGRTQTLSSLS